MWNAHNPLERFCSAKTRQITESHLGIGDSLWSNMPYVRPLATIVKDRIANGMDSDNAGVHDEIESRCELDTHTLMGNERFDRTSHRAAHRRLSFSS